MSGRYYERRGTALPIGAPPPKRGESNTLSAPERVELRIDPPGNLGPPLRALMAHEPAADRLRAEGRR